MAAETRLRVVIQAKDEASGKVRGVSKSMGGLRSAIGSLLPVLGVVGLVGAFVGVVKKAADFEQQMSNIATLLSGDSKKAIDEMSEGILELTRIIPKDPRELGAAAYQIVSAGISDTAEALVVLEQSSRLAVAGLGTTEQATDLLTSAINAFGFDVKDSEKVAAILFNTVKQGKTTVAELAQSFGMVAPIAAEMGVSLEELSAATAALTTTGLKTSVAQTQLRAAMASLIKPTAEAKELFEKLDVKSFKQLIERSGGLVGAFKELKGATEGNEEALAKAAGSVEGLNAILALAGAQSDSFKVGMDSMTEATTFFDEAVKKQNETASAQFQLLKNNLNVELIKLGTKILPQLISVMKFLLKDSTRKAIGDFWKGFTLPVRATTKALETLFFLLIRVSDKIGEFTSKARAIGGGITGIIGRARGFLPFQEGGIVPGPIGAPVRAIVHGGETIMPAGRSPITINVNNPVIREDQDIERITSAIARAISRRSELAKLGAI